MTDLLPLAFSLNIFESMEKVPPQRLSILENLNEWNILELFSWAYVEGGFQFGLVWHCGEGNIGFYKEGNPFRKKTPLFIFAFFFNNCHR